MEKFRTVPEILGAVLCTALTFLDIVLVLMLFILPFCTMGAYMRFTVPEVIFAVVYLAVREVLKRSGTGSAVRVSKAALRVIGAAVLVLYYGMLMGFYDGFRQVYPARKALYIAGNFDITEPFEFLPDKLPAKTEGFEMTFIPPVAAPDAPNVIELRFYTDETGIAEMRDTALAKGGVLCSPDVGEPDIYTAVLEHLQYNSLSTDGAEVYDFGSRPNVTRAYAISEKTGLCFVYWFT